MSGARGKRTHVPVEQRREQLTRAAIVVMEREGAWNLTTRAVASEAGVPLGAVHYAFDSKEALIAAVFAADIESAVQLIHRAGQQEGDPATVLATALRDVAGSLRREPGTELVLQELTLMGARDEALGELALRSVEDYRDAMTAVLLEVAEARGLAWDVDVRVLGELVFAQVVGLAQNWLATRDEDLLDACLGELAGMLATRLCAADPGRETGGSPRR